MVYTLKAFLVHLAPATCDEDSATSSQYESEPTNDLYQMMVNGSLNNMDTLDAMCSKPLADREIISLICDLRSSAQFSIVEQAELNKTIRTLNLELKEQASTSATLVARADAENLKSYRENIALRVKIQSQRGEFQDQKREREDEKKLMFEVEAALRNEIKNKDEQLKLSEIKMHALIKQSAEKTSNLSLKLKLQLVREKESVCTSNTCSCTNGAAATGAACTSNGANICTSCSSEYYKTGNTCTGCRSGCGAGTRETTACSYAANRVCTSNTCSCSNGVKATGTACTSNSANICTSCNSGYHLSGTSCVAYSCSCLNGAAATGAACTSNGANICTSCSSGYYKNGNSCSGCSVCGTGTRETTNNFLFVSSFDKIKM